MHMINLARLNGQVYLFVVHLVSQPEIIYLLENACHDIGEVEAENVMPDSGKGDCEKEGGGECDEEGDGECEKEGGGQRALQGDGECEKEGGDDECEQEGEGDGDAECEQEGDDHEFEQQGVVEGEIETQCEGDTTTVRSCSSSGEDGNGDGNVDVNDDYMEDLVDCEIQEDLGDANCFGDIETDVKYGGESATEFSDSDVDDGINCDDNRGLSDE
ncbi:hypothetical protein V8G54_025006 [Vigna mungo]|uniref:Uncharacterized protein n=1 Tax=Vigna mungo TaxID=3915 RepID=A0AAQ3N691_VIGMU